MREQELPRQHDAESSVASVSISDEARKRALGIIKAKQELWKKGVLHGGSPVKAARLLESVLNVWEPTEEEMNNGAEPPVGTRTFDEARDALLEMPPEKILELAEDTYRKMLPRDPIHAYAAATYFELGKKKETQAFAKIYELYADMFANESDPQRRRSDAERLIELVRRYKWNGRDARLSEAGKIYLSGFIKEKNSADVIVQAALELIRENIIDARTDEEFYTMLHPYARKIIERDIEREPTGMVRIRVNDFEKAGLLRFGDDDDLIEKITG